MGDSSAHKNDSFPLHRLVWNNNHAALRDFLKQFENDLEEKDNRGRTPLYLAITLGHFECANVLLENNANASLENNKYWTVIQEAVSTGDPEMVHLCLQYRDHQRFLERIRGMPSLLQKLGECPDFYIEMKWEFTSWVPLVSRICPSDTYKVWKSGSNVRIDTTLLGFDNMSWQRGSRSYLFKNNGATTTLLEVDYDNCQVYSEVLNATQTIPPVSYMSPSSNSVAARLTSPIVTTFLDVDKICFERSKSGMWGWRSDKMDLVDKYNCKVFCASNVHLVTKTRTEHLSEDDKRRMKKLTRTPLESFLGVAESEPKVKGIVGAMSDNSSLSEICRNPSSVTEAEYFSNVDLEGRDIGRPIEEATKIQKLKARLWLCEEYPLSLADQVVPIIDLMAASNTHFRKLKDFIALQLPSGFPVKIEIPLFHVLNARITFSNIFATDSTAEGVTCIRGDDGVGTACIVEDSIFEVPSSYSVIGDPCHDHDRFQDEEDELYQFSLLQSQQPLNDSNVDCNTFLLDEGKRYNPSLVDGSVGRNSINNGDIKSVIKRTRSNYCRFASEEDRLLQWALEESLRESQSFGSLPPPLSEEVYRNYISSSVNSFPPILTSKTISPASIESNSTLLNNNISSSNHISLPISYDNNKPLSTGIDILSDEFNQVSSIGSSLNPSISNSFYSSTPLVNNFVSDLDRNLLLAVELSRREEEELEKMRKLEEEEFNRIVQLSLLEK